MTDDKRPLPTGEHTERQYRQARPLVKALSLLGGAVGRQARELEDQFRSVERMKAERAEFARRFAPLGWTVFDRFSIDVTHDVVTSWTTTRPRRS